MASTTNNIPTSSGFTKLSLGDISSVWLRSCILVGSRRIFIDFLYALLYIQHVTNISVPLPPIHLLMSCTIIIILWHCYLSTVENDHTVSGTIVQVNRPVWLRTGECGGQNVIVVSGLLLKQLQR